MFWYEVLNSIFIHIFSENVDLDPLVIEINVKMIVVSLVYVFEVFS